MANLFKVRLNKTSDNFEDLFLNSFRDIHALTKKICTSENIDVKRYLNAGGETWLKFDNTSITIETEKYVTIRKDGAQGCEQLEYDFGKRSPAEDSFLLAVMSIFYHHVPQTEFFNEVEPYGDCFDDGVILAKLVNDEIESPFSGKLNTNQRLLIASPYVKEIFLGLVGGAQNREVRFYP